MSTDKFSRPGISSLVAVFAFIALGGFMIEALAGNFSAYLLGAAVGLLAAAEVLNYLAKISWRLDQAGAEVEERAKAKADAAAAAALAQKADGLRESVRQQIAELQAKG